MKRAHRGPAPEFCPNCGAEVPAQARACRECGACEQTGWSEQARYDALDLPDQEFDYEDFVHREFKGGGQRTARRGWVWFVAAGLVVAALLVGLLR